MQKKVSNYIAEKLLESGITDVFLITGGGAMHLDDALGHQEGLHCMYITMNRPVPWRRRVMPELIIRLPLSALPPGQGELTL